LISPPPPSPIEPGISTSEYAVLVAFLRQLLAVGTAALVGYATLRLGLHVNVPPEVLQALVGLEVTGVLGVVGYAMSRGVRKLGT